MWKPRHNSWLIAFTVTLATFMEVLDTSIANVALPHIAGGLSASVDESTWILTSYLVANAAVLPISAWLSGLIGRKRFYMICVALFTASSFMCGLAPSLAMLILFRVLQGAGGGGLQPSEQSILADTFAPAQYGMAFALYGMAVVLAPAIGPTLGGYVTDNFNWRWIFFINVPVGALSLMLTYRIVEDPPHLKQAMKAARRANIDYIGLGLVALGLGCLEVVLDRGQEDDWFNSHFIVVFAAVSLVALIIFVVWELRHEAPVLDLRLLRQRTFAMANIMVFLLGLVLYGSTVLLPEYLQTLLGYTAEQSGLVLSPGGFAIIALMPVAGILTSKIDARPLIAFGFAVTALALYHMTALNLQVDFKTVMIYRIYQSAGLAFLFVPISVIAYVGIPQTKSREVSAMLNLCRNIGGTVGISMITTILARRAQLHQDRLIAHVTSFDMGVRSALTAISRTLFHAGLDKAGALEQARARLYASLLAQASVQAYIDALWILAVLALLMVPAAFIMRRNDPRRALLAAH